MVELWVPILTGIFTLLLGSLALVLWARMGGLQKQLTEALESRRGIYDQLREIRGSYVTGEDCQRQEQEMRTRLAGFSDAVLKLEGVKSDVANMQRQSKDVLEQLIVVKEDVARITGRLESLNGKGGHR